MARQYKVRGAVADTFSIPVDYAFYNYVVGVKYYSDAYVTPVTPSAGSLAVSGVIPGNASPSPFANSPVAATDPTAFCSAGDPVESIDISTSAIVGATHYEVVITATKQ